MDRFDKEFITQMFLDSDNVSTMNRVAVAITNVVTEHNENMVAFNEALKNEFGQVLQTVDIEEVWPLTQKVKYEGYYEHTVQFFDDEEYLTRFKMKKSTVQVSLKLLSETMLNI